MTKRKHRKPKPLLKQATITFRMSVADRATLTEMAREMGLPLSEVLRATLTIVAVAWRTNGVRIKEAGETYAQAVLDVVRGVDGRVVDVKREDTNAPAL